MVVVGTSLKRHAGATIGRFRPQNYQARRCCSSIQKAWPIVIPIPRRDTSPAIRGTGLRLSHSLRDDEGVASAKKSQGAREMLEWSGAMPQERIIRTKALGRFGKKQNAPRNSTISKEDVAGDAEADIVSGHRRGSRSATHEALGSGDSKQGGTTSSIRYRSRRCGTAR